MLINAPEVWQSTDDKSTTTDDKPTITDDKPTIILAYLKEKGSCKTSELSAILGLKPTQTKAYLYQLLQEGKIVAHGANKNRTYTLA
jgi:predicted ArsR family transcriptional regulator